MFSKKRQFPLLGYKTRFSFIFNKNFTVFAEKIYLFIKVIKTPLKSRFFLPLFICRLIKSDKEMAINSWKTQKHEKRALFDKACFISPLFRIISDK